MSSHIQERVKGARDALLNSTMFYRQALLQSGCTDVHREIATEVGKALILTDKQIEFIASSKRTEATDVIANAVILLEVMKENKKLDIESVELILKGLTSLRGMVDTNGRT